MDGQRGGRAARLAAGLLFIEGAASIALALLISLGYYFSTLIYGYLSREFSIYVQGESPLSVFIALGFLLLAGLSLVAAGRLAGGRGGAGMGFLAAILGVVLALSSSAVIPMMAEVAGLPLFLLNLAVIILLPLSLKSITK